jgi:hypothetical protein
MEPSSHRFLTSRLERRARRAQSSAFTVVRQLVAIAVVPANPTVPLPNKIQLTARGAFSDGSSEDVTTAATWSSLDWTVATVSNSPGPAGLAASVTTGRTQIVATLGSVTGSAVLTVGPPALATIAVTPGNASLVSGLKVQFTATGGFADGTTQDETTKVTWASDNPAVATIGNAPGSQGLVTTSAPGTTMITATSGLVSGSMGLTVIQSPPPPALVPRFALVTNLGSTISTSTVDAATGQLQEVGYVNARLVYSTSSVTTAVDPSGRFAYSLGSDLSGQKVLLGFSVDPNTGALTPLPGSPFSTNSFFPQSVTVDATGKYVIANGSNNTVFSFTLGPGGP